GQDIAVVVTDPKRRWPNRTESLYEIAETLVSAGLDSAAREVVLNTRDTSLADYRREHERDITLSVAVPVLARADRFDRAEALSAKIRHPAIRARTFAELAAIAPNADRAAWLAAAAISITKEVTNQRDTLLVELARTFCTAAFKQGLTACKLL